jgi:phospholipid-binding lipoprotein MlaA
MAAPDLGRLIMNSTLGIGELLDPATSAGLDKNHEDFGVDLGSLGASVGPASDVRNGFGKIPDSYLKWTIWVPNASVEYGPYLSADAIETRAAGIQGCR